MSVAYEEQAQAVRTTAVALSGWAAGLTTAAERLAPAAGWRGPAADSAAEAVTELRLQTRLVAERPELAGDALRRCAAELEEAASVQRRADALDGPAGVRLGVEAESIAQAALRRASMALTELAPPARVERRGWRGQFAGLGRGAWHGLRDTYDFMHRMSPERAIVDPMGALRERVLFGKALLDDVRHPLAAAEAIAGIDELRDGAYGEWLGGLVAGAAIPGGRVGRLEGLGARTAVRLVDKGGPVTVRIGLRLPRGYPVHIKDLEPDRRTHILDGDGPRKGGGHRSGTGKPGKTEFPADWSDDDIIRRVMQTAMKPDRIEVQDNSANLLASTRHDGVTVTVAVSPDGRVVTAYPEPGGRGVVDNPRKR